MEGLLRVIVFHVRDDPKVARVLAKGVGGILARLRPFVMLLPWILLRHTYRIQVEGVAAALCKPDDGLVSPTEPPGAVEAVLKVPDDAVAELQPQRLEDRVEQHIEWVDLAIAANMVTYLPANAAFIVQRQHACLNGSALLGQVVIK